MSSLEATVIAVGLVGLWQLMRINDTLKDCLTVFKQTSEKIRSDLLAVQNEIRTK